MCEVEVPNRNNLPPEATHQKACLETLRELFKVMGWRKDEQIKDVL